ncbi:MAG TPA: glycosyltransferase family 4 protein [Ignavibacteria bacterium]
MKILYVTAKGGIHDYRFLKKLVNDYEVLLLHYAADELIPEIDSLKGLEIISKKPAFKFFPLASELGHFKKIVEDFKPDLIHTGYVWQVGIIAAYAGIHPHLSMPWGSDILIEPDKKFIVKKLVQKVMKTCDHVQCDAEFVKAKIMNDYGLPPEKITVFPWGIDLGLFKPQNKAESRTLLKIPPERFAVVFNRYLEQVYGVSYMLEAFNEFAKNKNDVLLLMASDGALKNEVAAFISRNNLESKINLIGKVTNAEIPAILGSSDVYISTSLSDGSSLSLLEALACGLGIIVSDVPAIKEWVSEENGIVVRRKNTKQITEALEKYYSNRELISVHGRKNIEIAKQRADWDRNYEKLKEIYRKISNL